MLKPAPGKIIVEFDPESEMTAGGLYKPETAQCTSQYGTILAVGEIVLTPGGWLAPDPSFKPGARVACGKYVGVDIEHDGKTLTILDFANILAIVEPTPALVN